MVLCNKRKIGVYFNPKTGSATLSALLKKANVEINVHDHKADPYGLEGYKFYCFYRDPVERYISGFNYIKRLSDMMIELLHYFHGERISCAKNATYNTLSDIHQKMIDQINPIDYFNEFVKKHNAGIVFSHQTTWLELPNVEPLNFKDFENQTKFVCGLFDIDPQTIPKINESKATHKVSELSQSEIDQIKSFYQLDYEYFHKNKIPLD